MKKEINTSKQSHRGFSHHASDEHISAYREMPFTERLRWLEENLEFMYKALTKEQWETLQKIGRAHV